MNWQLAPIEADWFGKSSREICPQLRDPARNGGRTMIELAQSFGKRTSVDYFLVVFFNVFYMLNLSLAYQEEYEGPVYGESTVKKAKSSIGLSAA